MKMRMKMMKVLKNNLGRGRGGGMRSQQLTTEQDVGKFAEILV